MSGLWTVLVPESGTNLILNPSAETTGNFGNHNSGTATRITTYARFGDYCYQVATGGTNRGMTLTIGALANADHYISFYARGNAANTLQASADNSNWNAVTAIGGATGGWVRYGVSLPAAQCNASTTLRIRDTANETFYIDGVLLQQLGYATTYFDGDTNALCKWTGLRHGATSTRDAQDRSGGRELDFDTDLGIQVRPETTRMGMPPTRLNLLGQALNPGAVFQSVGTEARVAELTLIVSGSSLANLHAKRQDLIDALKDSRTRGSQPVIIGYAGSLSGTKVYSAFRYAGGLEFSGVQGFLEQPTLRLVAVDPYWYEDNRETASLDYQDTFTAAYGATRRNGAWGAIGGGAFDADIAAIAVDKARNRVYIGGAFVTAGGDTNNNGICYYDGSSLVSMDQGCNGKVNDIAIAPNGDVWIVGSFTTVGSAAAATKGVARWNISTGTWTAFNESTGSFTALRSVAVSPTNTVYIAGEFTNWEGDAASDYIASTSNNGTDWDSLGTVPFSATLFPSGFRSLAIDGSGNLYVTARNTGAGTGSLFKWDGSSWTTIGTTDSASTNGVTCVSIMPDGLIYVGGQFSTIGGITAANVAVYNGTTFSPLGAGVSGGIVYSIEQTLDGLLIFSGTFTSAGGSTLADRMAAWNGYAWVQLDVDLPGSPTVWAVAVNGADIFIGFSTSGTATTSGISTVSPTATAPIYPDITLIGPSSASCTWQWMENQSTIERQIYSLAVQTGDTVHSVTNPTAPSIASDWRGAIVGQPLQASDGFSLLPEPATNTIAAFITGTTTGVALLLHWQPRHLSLDGTA